MIISVRGYECYFLLVFGSQGNLMVSLKGIQETHPRVPISGIHQLINFWHGKRVLWACSIQVREIHTDPLLAVLLSDDHGICQPFREEGLIYCSDLLQLLYLLPYRLNMVFG